MKNLSLLSVLCFPVLVGCAGEQKAEVVAEEAPRATSIYADSSDVVRLAWVDGPPFIHAFLDEDIHLEEYRDANAGLAIRSGHFGFVFDGRVPSISHLTLESSSDATGDLLDYSKLKNDWSASSLNFTAEIDGVNYRAVAGAIPEKQLHSPIRIIESGLWFHHIAVYGIELVAADGTKFKGKSRIELRAWSDQFSIEWFVEPDAREALAGDLQISLQSSALRSDYIASESFEGRKANRVKLSLECREGRLLESVPEADCLKVSATPNEDFIKGKTAVEYSDVTRSWEIQLPEREWDNPTGAAYPEQHLDRISNYALVLENTSDEPRDLKLRFLHGWHPLTGFVPMLLDADGQQTGLAIQTSKNWHVHDEHVPYDRDWVRASTRLRLQPNSRVELTYAIVHAQWQGVPMVSVGQLSLVGWGFNGFWTQMALGSWGESLCIQPGRTMRRSFVTDVRPFMVDSFIKRNRYDWPANLGGGDVAKIIDAEGKYVQWRAAVTDYKMSGPNLAHVSVRERSADEKLRLQIDTYLPRTDSLNRSYFKVKLEALEAVEFERIALFQLGSDYYIDNISDTLAWGNFEGRIGEEKPPSGMWKNVVEPFVLVGDDPWVSLYGKHPDISHRDGVGVRGLILRNFKAQIEGESSVQPWLSVNRAKGLLSAELVTPPSLQSLAAGDFVEFELELMAFPIAAKYYYGADSGLKERLEAAPNSWELTHHEVTANRLKVTEGDVSQEMSFPAIIKMQPKSIRTIELVNQARRTTLLIEGLSSPSGWSVSELHEGAELALGERYAEEASPQVSYDLESESWTVVLSLRTRDDSNESIQRVLTIKSN